MERKSIGSFIAALRRANGMTQQELADKLNVSSKAVSRWERDETMPDLLLIPAIAEIFGVTCDEILRGEPKAAYTPARRQNEENDEFEDRADGGLRAETRAKERGERRAAAMLRRTVGRLRTSAIISMALIVVGVAVMFLVGTFFQGGITLIGVLAMLIFDIAAAVITVLALFRARETFGGEAVDAGGAEDRRLAAVESFRWTFAVFALLFLVLWFVFITSLPLTETYKYANQGTDPGILVEGDNVDGVTADPGENTVTEFDRYPVVIEIMFSLLCPLAVIYLCYSFMYAPLTAGEKHAPETDIKMRRLRLAESLIIICAIIIFLGSKAAFAMRPSGVLSDVLNWLAFVPAALSVVLPIVYAVKLRGKPKPMIECAFLIFFSVCVLVILSSVNVWIYGGTVKFYIDRTYVMTGVTLLLIFASICRFAALKISKGDASE